MRRKRKYIQMAGGVGRSRAEESGEITVDADDDVNTRDVVVELSPFAISIVEVDPDRARLWLKRNSPENRTVSPRAVSTFAADMRSGAWRLTHQAIAFNEHGMLIDGQHRLNAVLEAERSVPMLVITHTGATVKDPIDMGRKRSISDIIGRSKTAVAALAVLRRLEGGGAAINESFTTAQAEAMLDHHGQAVEAVLQHIKVNANLIGALAWAWPVDPVKVEAFAKQVQDGEMIARGDPAYALREWLAYAGPTRTTENIEPRWATSLGTFNCMRYALIGQKLANVYVGESGYRAVTTRRRVLGIPYTPPASIVEPIPMEPTKGGRDR